MKNLTWTLIVCVFLTVPTWAMMGKSVLNLSYDPIDRPEIAADFGLFPHTTMGIFASTENFEESERVFDDGSMSSGEKSQVLGLRLQHYAAGAFKTGPFFLGTLASTIYKFQIANQDSENSTFQAQNASLGIGYAFFHQNMNFQAGANYILPFNSQIDLGDGVISELTPNVYTFDFAIGWLF